MTGERTYPVLSCPNIDLAIDFYETLGFHRSYRQMRPNPYAVVECDDIKIHLSAIDGFDPTISVGSVIVVVPDAEARYDSFAVGLRARYGRLPSTGIPRILRLRRKQGTASGFSVVDVGGNWLRFYQAGQVEEEGEESRGTGLARVVEVAARQGDARGDDVAALAVLDRGLARHADAMAVDRVRALAYRAELLTRIGRANHAIEVLAQAAEIALSDEDTQVAAPDLAHAREVVGPPG